jgi:hypothetical protein
MPNWKLAALAAVWMAVLAGAARAELCDFRLSEMIAKRAPALASETADDSTLGKLRELGRVSGEAKDFFTLVDGGGLTALGAVLKGSRAAKVAGGVKDLAEGLGMGGTIINSPAIGTASGLAALGMVGLEGVCRFQDERISDYYEVLAVLSVVAETADPQLFQLQLGAARKKAAVVEIWDPKDGVRRQYEVADLFFVNGELKLDRIGMNRSLGYLMQFQGSTPALDTPPLNAFEP